MKIDWGDGSPLECSEVIDTTIWFEHEYEEPGDYVVRLIPEEGAVIYVYGGSSVRDFISSMV